MMSRSAMEVSFKIRGQWRADAAIVFAWRGEGPGELCGPLEEAAPWFAIAPAWRDFSGDKDETALMYGPEKMDIPRVLVIGLGDTKKASASQMRDAFASALRSLKSKNVHHIGIDLTSAGKAARLCGMSTESLARELAAVARLALYRFDRHKGGGSQAPRIERLSFFIDGDSCPDPIRRAVRLGEAEAAGVCFARDLANAPANILPPSALADAAENLAARSGVSCTVLGPKELAAEGMNAMLAVASGSHQEPCAVILKYAGGSAEAPLVLVGKGLTFDSGGICLKPAAGMEEMKSDMSGAAAVLGVFEALDVLARSGIRPKRTVIGILACAENM
ncbi:MAG: aminopeptidase, partial [Mailhella sp.]|nr:aminopeptidase [Mailhella sp.]